MVGTEVFDKLRELQDILARKNQLDTEIAEAPQLLVKQEELLARYKANYIKKIPMMRKSVRRSDR